MRRAAAVLVTGAFVALSVLGGTALSASAADDPEGPGANVVAGAGYPGNPDQEARLVAQEDRRIVEVRAIANAAQWTGVAKYRPYRMATGNAYTLVLVAREVPYSFDDLKEFLPRSLVRQPDGSYLLSDNIVVDEGATLSIRDRDGLTLKLESGEKNFVSIVTIGGSLEVLGTSQKPVTITSWDATRGEKDDDTVDGRPYIRVMGGRAHFASAVFDHLGFWSGVTGGVSLTGMDTMSDTVDTIETTPSGNPEIYGNELLPVGGDEQTEGGILESEEDLNGYGYVSAAITSTTFSNNAFGLFVTSADGIELKDSTARDNLVDGIVLHRYVSNSSIRNTKSTGNLQDGFSLRRATTGVVLDRITASDNGRNGVTVNGGQLAGGPSATGMPIDTYGNNEISGSTIADNARYGVEVLSGWQTTVRDNQISGGDMGIVVSGDAVKASIVGNEIRGVARQAIAIRDGASGAKVDRNEITGGEHGIYVRDSEATVTDNTIEKATRHGVTFVGVATGSRADGNTVSGAGLSAIDTTRGTGIIVGENDTDGWVAQKAWDVTLRGIFQPLTVMWLVLGLIVVITALTGLGRARTFKHPYAEQAPLSSFSKGLVSRNQLPGAHS